MWLLLVACVPEAEPPDDGDGDGYSELDGDCDDSDATRHPGADERCDGVDQDCDGSLDEDVVDAPTVYVDGDGDGVGGTATLTGCDAAGVSVTGDCDDADPAVNPDAIEVCNTGIDEDCDGTARGCVPEGEVALLPDLEILGTEASSFGYDVIGMGDQTGDGLAEIVVSAPSRVPPGAPQDAAFVWVFSGAGGGRRTTEQADATIAGFPSQYLEPGTSLASGDLDGDGDADLLIGAPGLPAEAYDRGAVYILAGPLGGEVTADPFPSALGYTGGAGGGVLRMRDEYDAFGAEADVLPDMDGDGIADFAVSSTQYSTVDADVVGRVEVFAGGPFEALGSEPFGTITGSEGYGGVGDSVLGLPDADGDGLAEIAIAAPESDYGRGWIAIFPSVPGAASFLSADRLVIGANPYDRLGETLAWEPATGALLAGAPNDATDGDGDGELWSIDAAGLPRGTWEVGEVATQIGGASPGTAFGSSVALGDIDGDDRGDLAVGAYHAGFVEVTTWSGLSWRLTGAPWYVGQVVVAFDGDGDAFADLAVADSSANRVLVWRGRGL